jgi:hypothetical protein
VAIEALRQLEVLTEDDLAVLNAHHRPPIQNRRGLQVGEIRPVLTLE